MQTLIDLFANDNLMPHGYCLSWYPSLLWLHVSSDLLIALAYYSIPISLVYFVRQRKDLPYSRLFLLFSIFILACGSTHLLSVVVIWKPLYWLDGYVKAFTAIVSIMAAVLMLRIIPEALQLPSAKQLRAEIEHRKQVEEALRVSETKFRTLFDNSSDALVLYDNQGFVDCNAASLTLFGCPDKAVFLNKQPGDLAPEKQFCGTDSIILCKQQITKAVETGSYRFEWLHKRVDTAEIFPTEVLLTAININDRTLIYGVIRDIGERKRAEERLKRSEAQFRTLIETAHVGITLHDTETKVLLHNPCALRLFGLSSSELLNRTVFDPAWHILDEQGEPFPCYKLPVAQAVATRQTVDNVVMCVFHPNNQDSVWVLVTATPQLNNDGSVFQVICSFIDITRRKEVEKCLEQREAYFRNTFENAPIGVATLSLKGQFLTVNRTLCLMLAYSRDELLGMNALHLIQAQDRHAHFRYIRQLLTGTILNFSLAKQYISKNNNRLWGSLSVRLIRHADGSPDYVIITLENINERKRVEQDMIATRNQLQATLNAIPDLLLELGLDGHCYDIHTKHIDLLNVSKEHLLGNNIAEFLSPEATDVILSALADAKEHSHCYGKQFLLKQQKNERWIELSVASKQDSDDQPHFIVLLMDITERKLTELQLQENEARLNLSQEYGGIGSWEADLIHNRQVWSKITYQLVNYPNIPEPTWEDFIALIHPDDRQTVIAAYQAHLTQGKKYDVEYRVLFNNGKLRWMRSVGQVEFDKAGVATRFIGIVQDITERKTMEAELKRSNQELEQFAYAVSHDMRQPLRMVTSYLTLLEKSLVGQLNIEQQQYLRFAVDGGTRMDHMILSLLAYSRIGNKNAIISRVSSRAALNEALNFLEPELKACQGTINVEGEWVDLIVNADELIRLLQNLIANALKYHEEDKPPHVEISTQINAGLFKVMIRDYGIGIASGQVSQLFKVFSRLQTRSRFEGTGVGLALCRKIVEHYGGKIGVESAGEGQGSVFWFELPIAREDA